MLGIGTYLLSDKEVAEVLPEALKLGFRHIDTAQIYGNEAAAGAAIKVSGIPRDEISHMAKDWTTEFGKDDFLPSVEESLKKLDVDHVDLLLLHLATRESGARVIRPFLLRREFPPLIPQPALI
ncbi:aldo/keto reductase [Microbulbifer bruguierae]|uniref:Aldo/keto reductase n=1 Tax=Microbulbifer bruguierae TaxID=3029061 RepID=A0ABY8NFT1_9GAMM|nr:aldo/keto reductase [Microbulbifer bruguierae]WGL17781.1 aldo/keto reductase [Microbulbifer bruguierae]